MTAVAADACDEIAHTSGGYNESLDGDDLVVDEVATVNVESPVQDSDGGEAYHVDGTAQLLDENGRPFDADFTCFVQRSEGDTYSSIVSWRLS